MEARLWASDQLCLRQTSQITAPIFVAFGEGSGNHLRHIKQYADLLSATANPIGGRVSLSTSYCGTAEVHPQLAGSRQETCRRLWDRLKRGEAARSQLSSYVRIPSLMKVRLPVEGPKAALCEARGSIATPRTAVMVIAMTCIE